VTIVVGYIPTPEGRAALAAAIEEAFRRDKSLLVLNASRGDAYADPSFAPEAELASVREQLSAAGVGFDVRQLVRGKEPADEVVEAAADVDAELIVIGLRRRSAVGKLILGSTAQRILLDAPCPVLAVKAGH
jgi:nucleotide-binding universal stress UspA family protein